MGSRVKPGIIQKRILERGKNFQFTGLDDHDAVQIVNISETYLTSMECMQGKDWKCLLHTAIQQMAFYPLPCTVWTWTMDNVHTFFCDILRATLKLNLTLGRIGNTKQPNRGC